MTNPRTDDTDRSMTSTYVTVVVIEMLVLSALWVMGTYFGS